MELQMNSNVDSIYDLELTGTPTEKSVARKPKKQRKRFLLLVGAVAFIALPFLGIHMRFSRTQAVQPVSHDTKMAVSVVNPEKVSTTTSVELPGQTQAYTDAPIFAQTSGYLKAWYFDIGAKVKVGDVLAEIDTPEVDQELAQAQAQLKVAQSALDLSQATFQREQNLFNRKTIAAEDFDTAADTNHENQATVIADQANVNQLEALEAFKTIKAPFDGILTARDIDIGAYVAAGSGTQLFRVARISPLRVYINVPQAVAQLVKVGAEGDLSLSGYPGRTFPGHVTNTAVAIDPVSRALLVELQIPNESGELFPGAYAQVTLKLTGETGFYTIPANALLFRAEGAAVGVVHPDGKVEIRKITVNLDQGDTLQVSGGLSERDQVIVNPSDSLAEGMMVNVRPKQAASAQNQQSGEQQSGGSKATA
jgi:RND family efflux transporter MFP subunit